jgi:hypothetical protein
MILLNREFESISYILAKQASADKFYDFSKKAEAIRTRIKRFPTSLKDFRFHYAGILFHFSLLDLNEITELDLRVLLWFSV